MDPRFLGLLYASLSPSVFLSKVLKGKNLTGRERESEGYSGFVQETF